MRSAVALVAVAFGVAGCGQTYSVAQAREKLAAHGLSTTDPSQPFIDDLLKREGGCSAGESGFAPLGSAIGDLSLNYTYRLKGELQFSGGSVEVFCGTYDAERFAQTYGMTLDVGRLPSAPSGAAAVARTHLIRHGNLVLLERGRRPRAESAFAQFH